MLWSHLLLAAMLAAIGVVVTAKAWRDILHIVARDEEASHIYLLPLVLGWRAWGRRGRLKHCVRRALWVWPLMGLGRWVRWALGV